MLLRVPFTLGSSCATVHPTHAGNATSEEVYSSCILLNHLNVCRILCKIYTCSRNGIYQRKEHKVGL